VVKTEPDWNRLPEAIPATIRTLLRRCLRKDRRQRLQDATDVRIEIEEALATPATAEPTAPTKGIRALGRRALVLGVGTLLLVAAIASLATWILKPLPPRPVTRTVINLPPGDQLAAFDFPAIAISPDGTQLAYVAIRGGTRQIYLRSLDSLEAQPLAGTEGANSPFFSPDGRSLGFFTSNGLKKISVTGGAALTLANAVTPRGASWTTSGTIVFTPNASAPVLQVSDAGGAAQALTHLEKGETVHRWPEFLPGGKAVLFDTGGGNPRIALQSLATGERRDLVPGGAFPRYAASGHLIYAQGGNLMAAPFDPQRLQVTGTAVPVVEGVLAAGSGTGMQYAVSSSGSLVYVPGTAAATERLPTTTLSREFLRTAGELR
jgi:hypothetical protein